MKLFYVYILASLSRALYVGVTSNLRFRVWRHRNEPKGFSARYRASRLVYFEETGNVVAAIAREKAIKGWRRERKLRLIERENPAWHDLSTDF